MSTKITCEAETPSPTIVMPRIRVRVVCAFRETIETFAPVRALTSVDFPEFGAPRSATKPQREAVVGQSATDD